MKKVYLVEDDYGLRDLMSVLLIHKNFEVQAFPNATSFTKTINKEIPDLILMDIMLPDGNGVDLCKNLRDARETKEIPILLMSAHANPSIADGSGADAFLPKPFDVEELYQCIETVLEARL
ncbi:response regulator [Zunongwangia sp. F363]|uniref:Response regulator n=1 Tax=Autumnicola tepida TaxID=3075595 RepID=A0ABU3C8Z4_9FLAO|nr:response regulator [Zunongwangia sp. F363]MDT0642797.1 response regulator [Zunongwangia sp. F363]